MSDIETDLPRVKKVKVGKSEKTEKPKAKKEKSPKKEKAKPSKAAKKETKSAKKEAKKEKKAAKSSAKAASKAKGGKSAGNADAIVKALSSGLTKKPEAGKVVYTEAKTVETGLVAAALTSFNKKYSDKAIASVNHENAEIKKGLKSILTKNAAGLRSDILATKGKKIANLILGASKKAATGKLDAATYKEISAKISEIL